MRPGPNWLDAASIALIAAIVALALWIGLHGPETPIAVHYNLAGEADGWAPRGPMALMIGSMAVVAGIVLGGVAYYAHRSPEPARRRSLRAGQLVALLTMAGVTGMVALPVLMGGEPSVGVQMASCALLFLLIGAFLGRVGPNVAIGIRTPWAYKSKLAWERSNRLAGRLFFLLGLTGLIASPIAPQPLGLQMLIGGVLAAAAWSVFESWRVWRADPDRQPF